MGLYKRGIAGKLKVSSARGRLLRGHAPHATSPPVMSPDPAPRYAVVIPHYNDPDRLARCLAALAPQARDDVEVVVADNNSSMDLSAVQTRFDWARFVSETAPGAGAARNKGVAESSAPWIFFLDSDCVPDPDWLAAAREAAYDAQVITGGRVSVFDETPGPRSGAEAFETVFAFDQESYIRDKGFSVTANLIVARASFEAVGPFLVGVSEDLEWCQRAGKAGFRLTYAPGLAVGHPTRSDWPALKRKWLRLTQESFGLGSGRLAARLIWGLRALAMPASVLAHAPQVLRHPALSARERGAALLTLARLRLQRMAWMLRQMIGVGP